jgi:xylulokinase
MESVAFMLSDIIEMLRGVGIEAGSVTSLGGASASRTWMQIKADVLGMTLRTPACGEATCLGTALLAGVGAGMFADQTEAVAAMVQPGETYEPDPAAGEVYGAVLQKYRRVNKAVLTTFGG